MTTTEGPASPINRPPSSVPEARMPPIAENIPKQQTLTPNISSKVNWKADTVETNTMLRQRLDQLEYHESFTADSALLVQRLFSDLIQTTEAARKFKTQLDKTTSEKGSTQDQISPLRQEIFRLTTETNELHARIIQLTDEREFRERRAQEASRKLESQTADLRFMATQYAKRVETEQRKGDESRERVEQIMSKLGLFQQMKGDKKIEHSDKLFQRLQKIDIETGLEPLTNNPVYFSPPDPAIADMLTLSENKIDLLEKSRSSLESRIDDMENDTAILREQISKRDREIQRLGAQLEVSRAQQFGNSQFNRPLNSTVNENGELTTAHTSSIIGLAQARDRIDQLEMQIEYLQEHIDALEADLSNHDSNKKEEMEAYKLARDQMATDLKNERERSDGLLKNLSKLQIMLKELESMRHSAKPDSNKDFNSINSKQYAEVNLKLAETEQKLATQQGILDSCRRKNEKLVADITVLRSAKFAIDPNIKKKIDKKSDKNVENAEDKIKNLKLELKNSENEKWTLENDIKQLNKTIEKLSKLSSEAENHRARSNTLQAELEIKQKEIENLSNRIIDHEKNTSHYLQNNLNENFILVQGERDQLLKALEKMQKQLTDLQDHAEKVTTDRDNLQSLYSQTSHEIKNLREAKDLGILKDIELESKLIQTSQIELAEKIDIETHALENGDDLKKKIEELELQVEKLKQDLKISVLTQLETGAGANEAVRQLEFEMKEQITLIKEKDEQIIALKQNIIDMQDMIDDSNKNSKSRLNLVENQQIKMSQLEMEKERDRFQIRELKSKLADLESKRDKHKSEMDEIQNISDQRQKQLEEQTAFLRHMDQERDIVQAELDKKAEMILDLQDEIKRLKNQLLTLEQENSSKKEQVESMTYHLNQNDKEMLAIKRQADSLIRERDFLADEASRNTQEAKNLGSDLAAVSRENQILNTELVDVTNERDKYHSELVESERQVQFLDELCIVKEQEKDQLLGSYRKLIGEHERLDLLFKSSNEECDNLRMEIVMRDKRVQQIQKSLNDTSAELSQYKIDLNAYEKQCNNLTKSVATSERTLKHMEMDKARFIREINAARDLAQSLERSKDDMQKNLTAIALENDQLEKIVKTLETERENLTNQMRAEKLKSERLEHMIAMERTSKIQKERSSQDMQAMRFSQEDNLRSLNEQQSISMAAMSRELSEAKEKINLTNGKIREYELLLAKQKNTVDNLNVELKNLKDEMYITKDKMHSKEIIIEDLIGIQKGKSGGDIEPQSEIEKRIAEELESTRRQLKRYEIEIADRYREKSSMTMDTHHQSEPSNFTSEESTEPSVISEFLRNPVQSQVVRTMEIGSSPTDSNRDILDAIALTLQEEDASDTFNK